MFFVYSPGCLVVLWCHTRAVLALPELCPAVSTRSCLEILLLLSRASVARFRCRLSLRLKSISFCHIRECSFSRCRFASQVAPPTTNRLCLRTCWSSREMCSGCTAQGIVAMSNDIQSSLPFGQAAPCTTAHIWEELLRVPGLASTTHTNCASTQ